MISELAQNSCVCGSKMNHSSWPELGVLLDFCYDIRTSSKQLFVVVRWILKEVGVFARLFVMISKLVENSSVCGSKMNLTTWKEFEVFKIFVMISEQAQNSCVCGSKMNLVLA